MLRRLNLASGQLLQLFGIPGTLHSKRRPQAGKRRPQVGERRPQAGERRPQVGKPRSQVGKPRSQARKPRSQAGKRRSQAGKPRENEEFRPRRQKIVFRMLNNPFKNSFSSRSRGDEAQFLCKLAFAQAS